MFSTEKYELTHASRPSEHPPVRGKKCQNALSECFILSCFSDFPGDGIVVSPLPIVETRSYQDTTHMAISVSVQQHDYYTVDLFPILCCWSF